MILITFFKLVPAQFVELVQLHQEEHQQLVQPVQLDALHAAPLAQLSPAKLVQPTSSFKLELVLLVLLELHLLEELLPLVLLVLLAARLAAPREPQ